MTASYEDFLASKRLLAPSVGFEIAPEDLHPALFPFQRAMVRWSVRKGRSAKFANTGLGKTLMQLEWGRVIHERTNRNILGLAPLAVAQQTVREGERFGIPVRYARSQKDVQPGITYTNYEMLEHFDPSAFEGIILDESSILKNFTGATKRRIIEVFRRTPYRLPCTATPAPNDTIELCNHADFLSVMGQQEMVTRFFTPKGGQDSASGHFRLKAHARDDFWRWMASWAMFVTKPSDLGFSDEGFELPPLQITPAIVGTDWRPPGQLLFTGLKGVTERASARRATIGARVERTAELLEAEPDEPWLVWCGLNDEGRQLAKHIPGAVVIEGSDAPEHKAEVLEAFALGQVRVLITKPSIAGFGMNFQRCARQAFLGLSDSYEEYYQAIRRCWRFGQTREVHAHIVLSEVEAAVYENVLRKERQATEMGRELVRYIADFERAELGALRTWRMDYQPTVPMMLPSWLRTLEYEEALS